METIKFKKNQTLISLTGFTYKIKEVKNNFIYFYENSIMNIIHINTMNEKIKKSFYIIKK